MKAYETPKVNVLYFDAEDVIVTSYNHDNELPMVP